MDNHRMKHLDLVQGVINRLAGNSFLIKGWSVTLVAALLALSASQESTDYILFAFIPILSFWILDGYFLWQERLFRRLYDSVCRKLEAEVDFSMKTCEFEGKEKWFCATFSVTLIYFHFMLMVSCLFILLIA